MSHFNQVLYCIKVKSLFPSYFRNKDILDVGSMDINGNNRYLFNGCEYKGIDIFEGKNVWMVAPIHTVTWVSESDTIISTEMLEHDKYWEKSLQAMTRVLRPGGLLVITCATTNRPEHGTKRTTPQDSPATTDYYRNITEEDIRSIPGWVDQFILYRFSVDPISHDLQFFGIKDVAGYKHTRGELLQRNFQPSKLTWLETYCIYWFWRRVRDFKNAFRKLSRGKQPIFVNAKI